MEIPIARKKEYNHQVIAKGQKPKRALGKE
jgi:hypothetical protein